MSDLQLGLLILGLLAVAGVLVFNKVQEMRARRDGAKRFGSAHPDVLLDGGDGPVGVVRAAAGGSDAVTDAANAALQSGEDVRIEPVWTDPPAAESGEAAPTAEARSRMGKVAATAAGFATPVLDPRIDFIAVVKLAKTVPGALILAGIEKFPRGRNVDADGYHDWAAAWEALNRDAVYEKVRVGVQISDRAGPLRVDELETFQLNIAKLGAALGGTVEWPDEQNPLTRAAELDAFCASVDVQIGINVVALAALADTKLRGLAEANGFTREDDGVFRRRDDDGAEVLSMRQASPGAVSFTLDVPRVAREAAALALMAQCAKRFAAGVDGKLVDDQGKPLNDAGIAAIQSSLATIYGRMEAAAMPAGSMIARRVFS